MVEAKVVGQLPNGLEVPQLEARYYHGDVRTIGIWEDGKGWLTFADVTPEGSGFADLMAASADFYARLLYMADIAHTAICVPIYEEPDWRKCSIKMCVDNYLTLQKVGSPPRCCGYNCEEHEGAIIDNKCQSARDTLASRITQAGLGSVSVAS